jgi:CheY-like chemotaxis protein
MSKPLILVVEDNPVEQMLVGILAERAGVDACVVTSGYKALALMAESAKYDAVLLNYMLPAMSGPECAQKIRELEAPTSRHVPIIAVTARAMEETRLDCLESGMDDFLSKPYTIEQFQNMLTRWLPQEDTGN